MILGNTWQFGLFECTLVFVAMIIGWCGGRYYRRRGQGASQQLMPLKEYYRGINLLLNERPDQAVDVFLKNFEVTGETIETYLGLGTLFRRRGESSRAIRIHQHLLAKGELNRPQQEMVQLELARDYFHAGMFDRAQGLLNELVELGGRHRRSAIELLIQIHEQFKEWEACETLGIMLLKAGDDTILPRIAHYMCENAERMLLHDDLAQAKQKVKLASQYDKKCLRVLYLFAKMHLLSGDARDALRCIRRALSLDTDIFPELDELLQQSLESLGQSNEYPQILCRAMEQDPRVELVEAYGRWICKTQGERQKVDYIKSHIQQYPYWRLFSLLLDTHLQQPSAEPWFEVLRDKIAALDQRWLLFLCENCGFESQHRLWRCPSCRQWGKMRRLVDPDVKTC